MGACYSADDVKEKGTDQVLRELEAIKALETLKTRLEQQDKKVKSILESEARLQQRHDRLEAELQKIAADHVTDINQLATSHAQLLTALSSIQGRVTQLTSATARVYTPNGVGHLEDEHSHAELSLGSGQGSIGADLVNSPPQGQGRKLALDVAPTGGQQTISVFMSSPTRSPELRSVRSSQCSSAQMMLPSSPSACVGSPSPATPLSVVRASSMFRAVLDEDENWTSPGNENPLFGARGVVKR
eukprot:gene30428-35436_t